MILPDKHIPIEYSLISLGALVLNELKRPQRISTLWEKMRDIPEVGTFQRLVLTLDLLYMLGAIKFEKGLLRRIKS